MRVALVPPTLRGYRRTWLVPDLLAGVTLAAIAVPEQVATSRLAGTPPTIGLYAFLAGTLAFALLGTDPHVSIGADSTTAPVFAAAVASVAVAGSASYAHLLTFVALAVGVVLVVAGALRLGWIADFLPSQVIAALLTGIAIQIIVRQLPAVLGLPGGGTTTIGRLETVFDQRGSINGWAVGIALMVIVIVVGADKIDHRIPGALLALVASIALVGAAGLVSHGVAVVGSIHRGLPAVGLPNVDVQDARHLLPAILTVSFLCVVQTAATVRSANEARSGGFNHDLISLGAGNVLAGLTGSFAVNTSPPRTEVVSSSGGRSQATGLVACVAVIAVLVGGGLLHNLPEAALGAILMVIATRLLQFGELRRVLQFDRIEFVLAAITVVVVALVGIEQGVVTAILLSLAERVWLAARPADAVLGREPGTDHWIPVGAGSAAEQVPGVLVYLLYAPIWYGNAQHVTARMRALVNRTRPRAFVLDADGISDIDFTGAQVLSDFLGELHRQGVKVGIARTSQPVHRDLRKSGFLDEIGEDHVFPSVQNAVTALTS